MSRATKCGFLVLGAAVVALGAWPPAAAQEKGTIYYMIPTLLDEFQTESQKAIEGVFGDMGYEVVSLDAQNRADLQLNQAIHIRELQLPEGVTVKNDPEAIVAQVSLKVIEEIAPVPASESSEPEVIGAKPEEGAEEEGAEKKPEKK